MSDKSVNENRILIVEDDQALGRLLTQEVLDHGLDSRWISSAEKALPVISQWSPDVVVSDLRLPGMDGLELMARVRNSIGEGCPDFLIITAFGTISRAVESLKAGAEDFLTKPLDLDHFMIAIKKVLRNRGLRREVSQMRDLLSDGGFQGITGQSRPMLVLFDQMARVAQAEGPVLVLGESGTGKELVARAIHRENRNRKGSFLAVNCAGIPEHLLESEFFGHRAGAFTGAGKPRPGLFAEAEGGTLLLDEISEMPMFLQAKLLRMLQDGKIRPVGADREEQVDVRIIAATHQDLENEVRQGSFREDLFFRLETFTIRVPPLRQRGDDLELLAARFLEGFCIQAGKRIQGFDESALEILNNYHFPGNVRELKNAVERAVTFCDGRVITARHLPARIRESSAKPRENNWEFISPVVPREGDLPTLSRVETDYIRHVLERVGGNKRRAAAILGIGRRTLYRRLEQ